MSNTTTHIAAVTLPDTSSDLLIPATPRHGSSPKKSHNKLCNSEFNCITTVNPSQRRRNRKRQPSSINAIILPAFPTTRPSSSPSPIDDHVSKPAKKTTLSRRRRNNQNRSVTTNVSTRNSNTNHATAIPPMSPSASSLCSSLVSIATASSSGLSSGASSMRTLNDPEDGSHPLPDTDTGSDSVIKSSSSSAASSAGFCDMTSNDDVDEEDLRERNASLLINGFFDDPLFFDSPTAHTHAASSFSRQWSLPNGLVPDVHPVKPTKGNKKSGRRHGPPANYPNLSNPLVQQFFNEQRQFYRKIYDQQFAVLSAIKVATTPATSIEGEKPKPERQLSEPASKVVNGYVPHQHLGLPPLPPPPATNTPWLFHGYPLQPPESIPPSPCEEAFLSILKSHEISRNPNYPRNISSLKKDLDFPLLTSKAKPLLPAATPLVPSVSTPKTTLPESTATSSSSSTVEPQCLAARAEFHKQIRDRLLAASEKRYVLLKINK